MPVPTSATITPHLRSSSTRVQIQGRSPCEVTSTQPAPENCTPTAPLPTLVSLCVSNSATRCLTIWSMWLPALSFTSSPAQGAKGAALEQSHTALYYTRLRKPSQSSSGWRLGSASLRLHLTGVLLPNVHKKTTAARLKARCALLGSSNVQPDMLAVPQEQAGGLRTLQTGNSAWDVTQKLC